MKKKQSKKNSKINFVLSLFFVLCLIGLVTLKQSNFLKKVCSCKSDIESKKKFIENAELLNNDCRFAITYNQEDLIEKQKSISIEEAGELK